eukprot:6316847-Amphidinium_carterae.1
MAILPFVLGNARCMRTAFQLIPPLPNRSGGDKQKVCVCASKPTNRNPPALFAENYTQITGFKLRE